MSFSMRHSHVFRKRCLIDLRRISVVGPKSAAYKYRASYGFEVCAIMLFTKFSDCCGPRGTYHIPVFLLMVPLIISSSLFLMGIYCFSTVMVH